MVPGRATPGSPGPVARTRIGAERGRSALVYKPELIDTSGVVLDEDLVALSEVLAKNAHDRWSRRRLAEGWRHGLKRDDDRKEHPCLVPFDALPESEKAYDRETALETLRALLALGYGRGALVSGGRTEPELAATAPVAIAGELQLLENLTRLD